MADKNLERRSSVVSLAPFIDPNRLLRVGGRQQQLNETIEVKYPLLLPPDHRFIELFVRDCHRRTLHGELQYTLTRVRERFWIPRARQLAKKVINKRNGCRLAPLKPANRLKREMAEGIPSIAPLRTPIARDTDKRPKERRPRSCSRRQDPTAHVENGEDRNSSAGQRQPRAFLSGAPTERGNASAPCAAPLPPGTGK
ncbi:hypothetical protein HPB47_012973 [Ixodes persulcatus]|uniref:Uncharacterized protein n=1 Tax=Ixodes persulcatus TaxID=34615 RepID=A0AC60NS42_IXOPE|nr:hypothetical protein HPB47_012973 [Ixodes persulcatus]